MVSKTFFFIGMVAVWASGLLGQDAPPATTFLGSKVCQACHPGVWLNFHRNAHFRSHATGAELPERTGCEGCHGSGRDHVRGAGDKTKIRVFGDLTPSAVIETCLGCHSGDFPRAHIQRSSHTLAGVACTSCHSIHHSPETKFLLASKQADLCYQCHPTVRSQFAMPFKHRVNEGSVSCTDCHNPHGIAAPTWRMGQRPRMVDVRLGNEEPCLKCHSDKRGPFAFEHPAVRVDGCETCHSPHGSMNARLLRRPAVFTVCLECHNGAGNFGRQANGIPLQSASHDMTDPRYRNCTTCHVRIHGSNSSRLFLR
jgi:DmsE family decaheme c-type cytochrome